MAKIKVLGGVLDEVVTQGSEGGDATVATQDIVLFLETLSPLLVLTR
jgi:hypothetical protein